MGLGACELGNPMGAGEQDTKGVRVGGVERGGTTDDNAEQAIDCIVTGADDAHHTPRGRRTGKGMMP